MKYQEKKENGQESDWFASTKAVLYNEHLLAEILLRIPVKSLIRFQCVSKYWLRLISDRRFGYNHTARNPKLIAALYFHFGSFSYKALKSVSLHSHQNLPTLSFLNSIKPSYSIVVIENRNGLTLCSYGWPHKYIVCNITTQKFNLLPEPTQSEGYVVLQSLAYDHAVSPYYKVLLICKTHFGSYPIDIYSSENSSWMRVHTQGPDGTPINLTAFCKGAIHWMTYNNYYFRFEVDIGKLIANVVPPERRISSRSEIKFFGECGGELLLVHYSSPAIEELTVFQMDMENDCWILKQCICHRAIIDAFTGELVRFNLLTVMEGPCGGDIVLVLAIQGKVIGYDPRCNSSKVICQAYNPCRKTYTKFNFHTSQDELILSECLRSGGAFQHFENLTPV